MTANRKLVYTTAAVVLPAVLVVWMITLLGWIGAVLSAAAGVAGVIAYRRVGGRPSVQDSEEASVLSTSGLPTADETVFLELSASVRWRAVKPESYHADVARDFVLRRAREVTNRWRPTQYALAQHELAADVGRPATDESGELEVWATDVRLNLPQEVQQHLAKMDAAQRDGLLWEVGALNQRRIRDYLRDDALRSPASAVVWWLAQNDGSVQRAVDLADVLAKLSHLATGQNESDGAAEVQQMVDAIQKLEDTARRPAAHDLAEAFDQAGLTALAMALRDRYNLPTLRSVVDITPVAGDEAESLGVAGEK